MNDHQAASPKIHSIVWGKIEAGGLPTARDIKLFPGGGREWDWSENNTHHVPGIQIADVQELVDKGCEVIVLTRGMHLVLQTCPDVLPYLKAQGIAVHVEESSAAAVTYNRLVAEGKRVGGLFHSTC